MTGILAAFVIALVVAILFSPYRRNESLMPLIILFFVLFLAGLSAQFWIVPFGPVFLGVNWLGILFVVFIFALLFSAPPLHRRTIPANDTAEEPAVRALSAFVWIILFLLVISIAVGLFLSDSLLARP